MMLLALVLTAAPCSVEVKTTIVGFTKKGEPLARVERREAGKVSVELVASQGFKLQSKLTLLAPGEPAAAEAPRLQAFAKAEQATLTVSPRPAELPGGWKMAERIVVERRTLSGTPALAPETSEERVFLAWREGDWERLASLPQGTTVTDLRVGADGSSVVIGLGGACTKPELVVAPLPVREEP